jgi:hypothetical protein
MGVGFWRSQLMLERDRGSEGKMRELRMRMRKMRTESRLVNKMR